MTNALPSPASPLRIGTRGSPLALAQAHETRDRLAGGPRIARGRVRSGGDQDHRRHGDDRRRPLKEIGGKGLFTKEIEEALLSGAIDIAVHSMKDMPVEQPDGLVLDCALPREDVRDAFVSPTVARLVDLPEGATVGSSSLRRRAQLAVRRPDLRLVEFRGNVQTRMRKLEDGVAVATFLAMAGLNRLGMAGVARSVIDPDEMLPAVAQGAIGIERRRDDSRTADLLAPIHDRPTGQRLAAERAFLAALDGSCETPIAGLAELDGSTLWLRGEILRPDGSESLTGERRGAVGDGAEMGADLARELLDRAPAGFFDWRG